MYLMATFTLPYSDWNEVKGALNEKTGKLQADKKKRNSRGYF